MSFLRRLGKDDAGAALVESLVATTLMALALMYLVGSFSTLAIASRNAEQVALGQTFARAQAARIAAAPYRDDANYDGVFPGYDTPPPGITVNLAKQWWNGGSNNFAGGQNTNGLEKLTLTVTYNGSTISSIEFVKGNR
jgi:type II secretory pathway pseudopilin PulG